MKKNDIEKLCNQWIKEGKESDLGLWWIIEDIRSELGTNVTEHELRKQTLEAIRFLLIGGELIAVDLLPNGKFNDWKGEIESQISKIEKEWKRLKHTPGLGEIVWFIRPK